MTAHAHVRDVDEATFAQDVIERSRTVPVVVDFWAAWCGPCRILGPTLERLAAEGNGAFELVKVDVDRNPHLSHQYGIQGIPAVKAFRDGQVVAEFVGALPEAQVRQWLRRIVPSRADELARQGLTAEARGDTAAAERAYREALAQEARHTAAAVGLARILAERGDLAGAEALLRDHPADPAARRLATRLRLRAAAQGVDLGALQARLEADPRDVAAHYQLGLALAADEAYTAALDHLLEAVRLDRRYADDAARKAMIDIFNLLGDDDPRTQEYRRRLSAVLF
jgi:putative thioredoxin